MPQLVKGGKYVFGWCVISQDGAILLPEEARREYHMEAGEKVILMPGSRTSGGFSVAKKSKVEQSKFSDILAQFQAEEGQVVHVGGRALCMVTIRKGGSIALTPEALEAYGVRPDDRLLAARGSGIGIGLAARGPLLEEARKHPEIDVFICGEPGK